jgi:predicted MFS family arabinose efflux permease
LFSIDPVFIGDIGPYLATEQAALTDVIVRIQMNASSSPNYSISRSSLAVQSKLAEIFGYYGALGFVALALGNVLGGQLVQNVEIVYGELFAFKMMFIFYSMIAMCMIVVYLMLSPDVEVDKDFLSLMASITSPVDDTTEWYYLGLKRQRSRTMVGCISILFAMDAFAGGFVIPTAVVVWLTKRWDFDSSKVGLILSATSVVSGVSSIIAGYMVKRCGSVPTVIYTQMPSNIFVMLIPLMPTATSAVCMLVLRFSMSMMHMPATQAYLATVVSSSERSAAGGIANVVRSLGLAFSAIPLAYLQSTSPSSLKFSLPFFICGGLKTLYDLLLYILYIYTKKPAKSASKALSQRETEEQPLLQN